MTCLDSIRSLFCTSKPQRITQSNTGTELSNFGAEGSQSRQVRSSAHSSTLNSVITKTTQDRDIQKALRLANIGPSSNATIEVNTAEIPSFDWDHVLKTQQAYCKALTPVANHLMPHYEYMAKNQWLDDEKAGRHNTLSHPQKQSKYDKLITLYTTACHRACEKHSTVKAKEKDALLSYASWNVDGLKKPEFNSDISKRISAFSSAIDKVTLDAAGYESMQEDEIKKTRDYCRNHLEESIDALVEPSNASRASSVDLAQFSEPAQKAIWTMYDKLTTQDEFIVDLLKTEYGPDWYIPERNQTSA
ncbi:uncharacterized protein IL334_004384 [Kwoniella shivajii]|uniref:No apical meristem-associated C-terminal domain-containing protein n=1 Tax=Kwoniella shivajii TaxID=564305 RepID=A0ABZ1D0B8_9TREE|nr:hypothetical protein IL334_004384 [Kwoniella shivajii]